MMNTALNVIIGISWSIAYIFAIVLCLRNKTSYIPPLSICMNFSWELLVVVSRWKNANIDTAFYVQLSWLLLDIFIVMTWLYYKSKYWKKNIITFVAVFVVVYGLAYTADQWEFSVFLVNAIMSFEFLYRHNKEKDFPKSIVIATTKLVGTLTATIQNGCIYWNPIVLWLGGICFFADLYYLMLLVKIKKEEKK